MTKKSILLFLLAFIVSTSMRCDNASLNKTVKNHPSDPFTKTMTASQLFTIDAKQDNVVEGENGTTITCPKGCFKNAKGEIVEDNVQIELSEALSIEEMILSNLTTTADGKLLETDGMIYFNVTANGEQLTINKDNPIHLEIPTFKKKPGMMAYEGVRDSLGNMNWIAPQALDNFLKIVPIDSLDFLPEGFQNAVDAGMPYKGYAKSTKKLTASLYYSLSTYDGNDKKYYKEKSIPINEPYYNTQAQVRNKKYTSDSYDVEKSDSVSENEHEDNLPKKNCGIDPAIIKVIHSAKYQKTLIATKEFEARLKVIFKTCSNELLEIYTRNLDKNLYELDSMAAAFCEEHKLYVYGHDFLNFAKLKQTKVKEADKYSALLNAHYEKNLAKVKQELERDKAKLLKVLENKNKEAEKIVEDYKKLLWKREKHRMETYGLDWTKTGWVNIDTGPVEKDFGPAKLEVKVENGETMDRVYTYVIYESIKSLYRLNTSNNKDFYAGNSETKEMLMPKEKVVFIISIGYKNEIPYIGMHSFTSSTENFASIILSPTTPEELKVTLSKFQRYSKENTIARDLVYMEKFYKEELRQKVLKAEQEFIKSLYDVAFPCCDDVTNGEILFNENGCKSCHSIDKNGVGPALANATTKYTATWLYKFTTNSSALIASGDQQANALYLQYGKSPMPSFAHLTKEEVAAIYKYIDETKGSIPVDLN
ncbi:MAG: cytochrome c, mono- and diheme variant family [Chitinophagaceae bacterium]|nr:cytochrome c, mono- and diheme variant family [Chitinophagaceae bacterium]